MQYEIILTQALLESCHDWPLCPPPKEWYNAYPIVKKCRYKHVKKGTFLVWFNITTLYMTLHAVAYANGFNIFYTMAWVSCCNLAISFEKYGWPGPPRDPGHHVKGHIVCLLSPRLATSHSNSFLCPPPPTLGGKGGTLDSLCFPVTQMCVGIRHARLFLRSVFYSFLPVTFKFWDMVVMDKTLN